MDDEKKLLDGDAWSSYLCLIPRGLQHVVSSVVKEKISPDHKFRIECLGESAEQDDTIISKTTKKVIEQRDKKQRKRQNNGLALMEDVTGLCKHTIGSTIMTQPDLVDNIDPSNGNDQERHIAIGYTHEDERVWSQAGKLCGFIWYKLETDAPPTTVAKLRCFGPILALVAATTDKSLRLGPHESLSEASKDLSGWMHANIEYPQSFDRALNLWVDYAEHVWKGRCEKVGGKSEGAAEQDYYDNIRQRFKDKQLKYRLSCLRSGSSGRSSKSTNKYNYTRQELLTNMLADGLVPSAYEDSWAVDLTEYDIEVVVLILDRECVAIGLTLLPYQRIGANTFANGSTPPDITEPYIGGEILSGLVRLRPSTAHLLLNLANLKSGEVVLDPCAGIGTIPLEADRYYFQGSGGGAVGIGGDIVLGGGNSIGRAADALFSASNKTSSKAKLGNLAAWDASLLPIRAGSIDVVVSDLPFGQSCLSSLALAHFLPIVFMEIARVLAPSSTSRAVLLCGSNHEVVLRALAESGRHWIFPCESILPVNIGGVLAWVFVIKRNNAKFENSIQNHLDRVRKTTRKRDQSSHYRATTMQEENAMPSKIARKKRIQH